MTPQHLPGPRAPLPDVGDHEGAASVSAKDRRLYAGAVHDDGEVATHVDDLLLDAIRGDDVLAEGLEPLVTGKDRPVGCSSSSA